MSTVYVALDIEATGMNPATDRIIEIAAVKFTAERVIDRWETLVRPGMAVPFAVTTLTGITPAQVNNAPPFSAVAPTLRAFLGDCPIVGQSIEFDLAMLKAAGLTLANPLVDTFELAALLLPQLPAYSLGAVAEALQIPLNSAEQHRARVDAELARQVFARLWQQILTFEAETLGEVVKLTAGAGWPLHRLFVEAQRTKTREAFGSSLGGALRTALGVAADAQAGELAYLLPRNRPEPLQPTGVTTPLDLDHLAAILAADSPFAHHFAGFEPRPQQAQMLRAVAVAFNEASQLLVEAGTGTGKSIAYLLPAIASAVRRGETVVVSTKTIQLQDQLFHKDLPALQEALAAAATAGEANGSDDQAPTLPASFRAALVKGRSNYLCLRRWFALRRAGNLPKEEVRTLVKILLWLQVTETGDQAELRLLPGEEVTWARVMATPDACNSASCPYNRKGQCYLSRARRQAEAAHIVVVNHALLLSDMISESQILPPYKHLIIDEAHRLEDEATAQLGYTVDRRGINDLLDGLAQSPTSRPEGRIPVLLTQLRISKVAVATQQAAELTATSLYEAIATARRDTGELFEQLEAFATSDGGHDQHDPRLRLTDPVRRRPGWSSIERAWERLSQPLLMILQGLTSLAGLLERLDSKSIVEYDTLVGDLAMAQRSVIELHLHLHSIIANPDPGMIFWCEVNRTSHAAALYAAPLHVGATLQTGLYQNRQTLVLTSATLTTDSGFDYLRERLGLADATGLQLGSPFDFKRATLLYLADDLPEPGRPGYQKRLEQSLIALCRATNGRALILFTSHSALRATYAGIKAALEQSGILVLGQRIDGSPRQLIERLRNTPRTIILGTASFWEGVDVVGDALSLLVITKLPFAVPSDPIFAARSEQFDHPFPDYAVPQAILTFKQGFGRLIRSRTDRGVVAVLDRRLVGKAYGRSFIDSLPDCTQQRGGLDELATRARDWLANA